MSVFNTGDFQKVSPEFFKKGKVALDNLTDFQKYFDRFDTDTIINEIRDAIVARILRYNLVNLKNMALMLK